MSGATPGPYEAAVVTYKGEQHFGVVTLSRQSNSIVALCGLVGAEDEAESIATTQLIARALQAAAGVPSCKTPGAHSFTPPPPAPPRPGTVGMQAPHVAFREWAGREGYDTAHERRRAMELADYTQAQVDGMSHYDIADALRGYPHPLLEAAADSIAYLAAQEGLLEKAQQAAERASSELAETKRPLDNQMARLNRRLIELTGELDALRLKLPAGVKGLDRG